MGGAACTSNKQQQDEVSVPQTNPNYANNNNQIQYPNQNGYQPPINPNLRAPYPPPAPQLQQNYQPAAPSPYLLNPNAQITVMKNDMSIRKNSFVMLQNQKVSFQIDILNPVVVSLYFFGKEQQQFFTQVTSQIVGEKLKEEQNIDNPSKQIVFISQKQIDLDKFQNIGNHSEIDNQWPLIIQIERTIITQEKQSLYVYCIFQKHGNDFLIKPIQRKLDFNKSAFEVNEIYGIANSGLVNQHDNQANMEDTDKECVVCICEKIDTIIMPCRHMCVCVECAQSLQNQTKKQKECPICRKSIESFLRIKQEEKKAPPPQNNAGPIIPPSSAAPAPLPLDQ